MTKDEKYMKEIANCNKRIYEMQKRLDDFFSELHEKNAADIGYIAMMADIELDDEEEVAEDE